MTLYYIILYCIILYYIILYYIILYYIILYYIILYYIILYYIILYYIILYYIILYYIILYYIILYYIFIFYFYDIILYYTILYHIILYYFILCCIRFFSILYYIVLYLILYTVYYSANIAYIILDGDRNTFHVPGARSRTPHVSALKSQLSAEICVLPLTWRLQCTWTMPYWGPYPCQNKSSWGPLVFCGPHWTLSLGTLFLPGPPKVPKMMAQHPKIESMGSIRSSALGILEVQVVPFLGVCCFLVRDL